MHDIKVLRETPDKIKEGIAKKGVDVKIVDEALEIDGKRRVILQEVEKLKAENNKVSADIAKMKREGKETAEIIASMKKVTDKIKELDEELAKIEEEFNKKMVWIPNIPNPDVPVGK